MPVILRFKGYKFFFFSNEGAPLEPLHIHVRKGKSVAKFWVQPVVRLAEAYEMSPKELCELVKVIEENRTLIERNWNEYFGD